MDAPVPSAAGVRVVRGSFASRYVAGPVGFAVARPDDAAAVGAVAYLLPGRGGSANDAMGLGFDGFLAAWLRGGGRRFAIAAVDAGESYFHPRRGGEDRLAMATSELPHAVRGALGTVPAAEALLGQSMGGYGALLAAERDPKRFRAVAVAGPAIFPSYADERGSVGDAFDDAADFARYDVVAHGAALRGVAVMVRSGSSDPFVPGVGAFARAVPGADVRIEPGCHDDGFWRVAAAPMLGFVGARL